MTPTDIIDDAFEDRVDTMCDRFEAELRVGHRPAIEDQLAGLEGARRAYVLRELLLVELDLLRTSADVLEYRARFPRETGIVDEAFSEFAATGDSTTPGESLPRDTTQLDQRTNSESPSRNFVGDQIGDYDVQQEVGRGGMGVVYQAKQQRTNRIVALKVIRTDQLDGQPPEKRREIIERFKNEAQAAASLDHEHIVTVFDIGEAEGQHFYSMKFVLGRGLDEVVTQEPLASRDAAAYLEPVIRAVHEAHQLGILHRDIKPSNILIESKSNRALVTDFGLAKLQAVGQSLTATGTLFGSPPYMSPEQILDSGKVGVATDVYGFGATLYHLVAGRAPFQAATPVETIQQVINEHAPAPRLLNSTIDRDIETICLKCLEKDTRRRYATAKDLADDLQRYLNNEPIHARPVSTVERVWRWCGRNRVVASVVASAATILVLATAVATHGYLNATHALDREAEQRQVAEERRLSALRSFELARNAIEQNVELITSNPTLRTKGLEKLRRDQLQIAQTFFMELVEESPYDLDLLVAQASGYDQLARIHLTIGELHEARAAFDKALHLRSRLAQNGTDSLQLKSDLADTRDGLAMLFEQLGLLLEAEQMSREAFIVREELARSIPDNVEYQQRLAESHAHLGAIFERNGGIDNAVAEYQQALQILDEASKKVPPTATFQIVRLRVRIRLARLEAVSDRLADAQRSYEAARDLAVHIHDKEIENSEAQEMLAMAHSGLANVYHRTGMFRQAETTNLIALESIEQLTETHPDVVSHRRILASCLNDLASVYRQAGRGADAEAMLVRALAITKSIVELTPEGVDHRHDLAIALLNLGNLYAGAGKDDEAEEMLGDALDAFEAMSDAYPTIPEYCDGVVSALRSLANVVMLAQRFGDAEHDFLAAVRLCEKLAGENPRPEYQRRLGVTHASLGTLYANTARTVEAEQHFKTAIAILDGLSATNPTVPAYRYDLAIARFNLSMLLEDEANIGGSKNEAEASLQLLKTLAAGVPGNAEYLEQLAVLHDHLADFSADDAWNHLRAAVEAWEQLYTLTSVESYLLLQAKGSNELADKLLDAKEVEQSLQWYGRGIETLNKVQTLRAGDEYVRHLLRGAHVSRAAVNSQLKKHGNAVEDWKQVVALADAGQRGGFELALAAAQVRAGDYGQAKLTVELAVSRDNDNLKLRFDAAHVVAVAAVTAREDTTINPLEAKTLHEQLLEEAVRLLLDLESRGYLAGKEVQHVLRDAPEFRVVREHAKIRPLLESSLHHAE